MNDQKYAAILDEILTCQNSYWARKSKMLTLESELSPLEMRLVEFDVALRFSNARDLARSAEKIFQMDNTNERVRRRICQLFSALMDAEDRTFSAGLVSELSMELLQEMFFSSFPDQRNSTRGSLQVYLTLASNKPESLRKIATKLFANYLGASGEFQRKSQSQPSEEEDITPMDAVLFHLFDSLVSAGFGDLSLHNISQIFNIFLRNCFADSAGRIDAAFYSQSGISPLAKIRRPSMCWHYCIHVLVQLFNRRAQHSMAQALRPFPDSPEAVGPTIERALLSECGAELLNCAEFVRLVLFWTMTTPIREVQIGLADQMVSLPANVFWVDQSSIGHYWLYNLEQSGDEDSPTEIEEPEQQRTTKTLNICPSLLQPVRTLSALFASSPIAEAQLDAVASFLQPANIRSAAVLALMVRGEWKKALELLQRFVPFAGGEQAMLHSQLLQCHIALRQLPEAFQFCGELLKLGQELLARQAGGEGPDFPVTVAKETCWVRIAHPCQLRTFAILSLFHICWLGFAKCRARALPSDLGANTELLFASLIVLAQSVWTEFGFGLFQQLTEHLATRVPAQLKALRPLTGLVQDRFRCPNLLRFVGNSALLNELLGLDDVQMCLSTEDDTFLCPSAIVEQVLDGRIRLATGESAILEQFMAENEENILNLLASL